MDRYVYPAVFGYEDGEEISVVFPDLDVATSGTDDADALKSAEELLGITMLGMEEDGEEIPAPSMLSSIHTEANERTALIDVFMPPLRLANEYKSISRTVTLPSWLNARALAAGINFSQTLQEAIKKELQLS